MSEKLRRIPFFVPLISIFFVLHGVLENFGFVPAKDALILLFAYIGLTFLTGGIFWLFLREIPAAAILTAATMGFFFFYEAFIQWLTKLFPHRFFTTSPFLLAIGLLVLMVLFIYVKKRKGTFPRLYFFLNTILLVYILVDTGWLLLKFWHPPANPLSVYSFAKDKTIPSCTSCAKPDVYFLLFDEYASSLSLKEQYNYDNTSLDSFLVNEGFHINDQGNANYNLTAFSMASVLNMSYIEGIKDTNRVESQDYTHSFQLIRDNQVIKVFSWEGYDIENYSIFDLAGQPTKAWPSFLPLKTRLITARTLTERLSRNGNSLLVKLFGTRYFMVQDYMKNASGNEEFLQSVASEAGRKHNRPRFFYAHFMMPHFPYLFDSSGHRRTEQQMYAEIYADPFTSHFDYLGYLTYTNRRLEELVLRIRHDDPNAVILLCGDHGYRGWTKKADPLSKFQNLNAVFFPDQDYSRWNGKIAFVNQFRIVFNQLFHTNYSLLKDNTITLKE